MRTLYAAARTLGDLLYRLDRRHREIACRQIAESFPDWDEQRVRTVARESLRSIVRLGFETIMLPRLITPSSWRQRIHFVDHEPLVAKFVAKEKPTILLIGHYGNWEVGGYALATVGHHGVAVARALDNPHLDRWIRGVRERAGLRIVDKTGASAVVGDVLEDRGILCFIADQDAGRRGVFVDFFGRPASTFRTIALMAIRYEAPVAVTYARRLGEAFRFELGVERIIEPSEWADKDDPVGWLTQTYTTGLEAIIRRDPGQYFGWTHRRWKHQPGGNRRAKRRRP